jgi:hypothetical protein
VPGDGPPRAGAERDRGVTNGSCLSRSTSPRTRRLVENQPVVPSTRIKAYRGTRSQTTSRRSSTKRRGMASAASTTRISRESKPAAEESRHQADGGTHRQG